MQLCLCVACMLYLGVIIKHNRNPEWFLSVIFANNWQKEDWYNFFHVMGYKKIAAAECWRNTYCEINTLIWRLILWLETLIGIFGNYFDIMCAAMNVFRRRKEERRTWSIFVKPFSSIVFIVIETAVRRYVLCCLCRQMFCGKITKVKVMSKFLLRLHVNKNK